MAFWFAAGTTLAVIFPFVFTAKAWRMLYRDPQHSSGGLTRLILYANSFSAVLFAATILLAIQGVILQSSVYRIAWPNWFLCVGIALLSAISAIAIKARRGLYLAVFMSSGSLILGWLIVGSLH
jgi:hypothetical protein